MRYLFLKISILIGFCLFLFQANGLANVSYDEKHIEVCLRMIGHQVLLDVQDSSSRVLPIERRGESYLIQFETDFVLNPDRLILIVDSVAKGNDLAGGYILEVLECETEEVVYSYEKRNLEDLNMLPCLSREYPRACYQLLISLLDVPDELELIPPQAVDQEPEAIGWIGYSAAALILIFSIGLVYLLRMRGKKQASNPNLIPIGKYQFNVISTELSLGQQKMELTGKEADLLMLLYHSANTTIEREFILKKVWGDDGDYIGRTLDVFISRLRKKLESDSSIKIVNVRGVGYSLF